MSALDVAQRYFDGWNQHDAGFLVATFDPDGDGTRLPPGLRGVMLDRSEDLSKCRCGHAVAARPPMW